MLIFQRLSRFRIKQLSRNVLKFSDTTPAFSTAPKIWQKFVQNNDGSMFKDTKDEDIDFKKFDPNSFGNIADSYVDRSQELSPLKSESLPDDIDGYDKLEIKRGPKRSPQAYRRILQEYVNAKPFNIEKIRQLHYEFIYEDRYIPERIWYSLMLKASVRARDCRMAGQLFEEMKRYKLKPTGASITEYLNSCAYDTRDPKYSIEQAIKFRDNIQLSGGTFNYIHYTNLIKVFAIHGDNTNVELTLNEMKNNGYRPSIDIYIALLQGTINNPIGGLISARYYFIKALQSGKKVSIQCFNLFLKSIRECQMDSDEMEKFLFTKQSNDNIYLQLDCDKKLLTNGNNRSTSDVPSTVMPCFLTGRNLSNVIHIRRDSLLYPSYRFQLFGGIERFEELMSAYGVKPSIHTLTLLVDLLDPKIMYPKIIDLCRKYSISPDVMFYNVLVKRASKLHDNVLVKEILQDMSLNGHKPDIVTYGSMAFNCLNIRSAEQLLRDIERSGALSNHYILGTMITIAANKKDIKYVEFVLDYALKNHLRISTYSIEKIDLLLNELEKRPDPELREIVARIYSKLRKFKVILRN